MMIFHEGLPGAGKSWEACVYMIIDALKEGRRVITNIEGINHDKFAQVTGMRIDYIKRHLLCFDHADIDNVEERTNAQRDSIFKHADRDQLIVIDEIQDMFPSARQKMNPDHQKFFTEHRHLGLDLVLMGQDLRDCHNIIRRRINRKIVFTKMTAVGMPNRYKWEAHEAKTAEKFQKISSGTRSYDKKYFGLYASHTTGTTNTQTLQDDRTNIFKKPAFTLGVPAAIVVLYFSLSYLNDFFHPVKAETQTQEHTQSLPAQTTRSVDHSTPYQEQNYSELTGKKLSPQSDQPEEPKEPPPLDLLDEELNKYRGRLAGVVLSENKIFATIEIVDKSFKLHDRYTTQAAEAMGWSIKYNAAGLYLSKADVTHLIRPWPYDPYGRVQSKALESGFN